ncbi:MAG TPA: PaaI family thioesterase, partial [Burkholderiales bacterium]|nr:PaaI family thioesterase [Burkholderiales bacterium]
RLRAMKIEWNTGLITHLGIEFVEVTPDRVVARLKVSEKLMTVGGTVHGGTLMAFADTIGAAGTAANLAEGQRTATLESKTNFIAGCRSGTLQAEAKPIHKGKRTHVWETRITDEKGKLLSVTTQTQMIL